MFRALVLRQDPVVRKPINANPRLKVNRGFHRRSLKWVLGLLQAKGKEKSKSKLRAKNL